MVSEMNEAKSNQPIGCSDGCSGEDRRDAGLPGPRGSPGFFVYLGGQLSYHRWVMAQLDKTFPTNDCLHVHHVSKLVESGRHLNIRILANSEVERS